MYQAIVLDLDGTTLNEENTVNKTLIEYIAKLRESGKLVFIATGRTLQEVREVVPDSLVVDGMVTANGMSAFIGDRQVIEHALPPDLVEKLVHEAEERGIYYEVHPNDGPRLTLTRDKDYVTGLIREPKPDSVEENEWRARLAAIAEEIEWTDTLQKEGIAKIYFFSREQSAIRDWKADLDRMKQETGFTTASSTLHNVEITVEGISKATGVKLLLEHFELQKEDILAVGDGENDLPLFELAGHCVAMKNATSLVKGKADEVTDYPHTEDGLYRFLKKTFEE